MQLRLKSGRRPKKLPSYKALTLAKFGATISGRPKGDYFRRSAASHVKQLRSGLRSEGFERRRLARMMRLMLR